MANSKSTYLRAAIINAILKATGFTGSGTLYLSLHTASPGLNGANEVSGNAYARVAVTFGAQVAGVCLSDIVVTTAAPTPANWGTVTHFGVWDALTVGNFYGGDALTNQVVTSVGIPLSFPVGSLSWTET